MIAAHRRSVLAALALVLCLACALFLLWGLRAPYGFIMSLRATKLAALVLVGASVGAATVMFQTVVGNRLLTPGLVGFDALFLLMQSLLIAGLGAAGYAGLPQVPKFLIETAVMTAAATALFGLLLRRGGGDMTRLVLTGVIFGLFMRGLLQLVQRLLDPSEFAILQGSSFASFNHTDPVMLTIAAPVCVVVLAVAMRMAPSLDVATLGRARAISLGVDFDRLVLNVLGLVAMLIAVTTALAGPVTFLGLLAASLAASFLNTYRHRLLLPGAAVVGALILVAGQFVFERLLGLQSTLSVIVEFFGGLVFLMLVLRRRPA